MIDASIAMQSQTSTLSTISQSVGLIRNVNLVTSGVIDNTYNQGKETLRVANATQQHLRGSEVRQREDSERQKAIQTKLESISKSQNQSSRQVSHSLERVHDSNMRMSAKIDDNLSQGEEILTITTRTEETIHRSEKSRREDSERLRAMEQQLEQLSSVMGSPGRLVGLVAEALDTHGRKHQEDWVVETKPQIDEAVFPSNSNLSSSESSMSNRKSRIRWKDVSYRRHAWSRYLNISSATRQQISDEVDSTEELDSTRITETTFVIRSKLPFLKRALYYTTSCTAWDPLYEAKVRYTRLFTKDSTIWKACKRCDLDGVRRLFNSGEASPFMENEWGSSLVDEVVMNIVRKGHQVDSDDIQLVDYLVRNCGRGGASVQSVTVWDTLWQRYFGVGLDKWENSSSNKNCANILRLVVEYSREDPLDHPGISSLINLGNSQDAVITALTQQPFWPITLSPVINSGGCVVENSRQLLEDPGGEYLRGLLEDARWYLVLPDANSTEPAFKGLFEIAAQTTRVDLRECCKNRMKLFINTPKYHRLLKYETLDFEDVARTRLKVPFMYPHHDVYVGRCAIRHGCRALLEEVLQELGWNDFDINNFFDKETFHGVPGLLDGEIIYESCQQMQQEFILNLCGGVFTEFTDEEIVLLAWQISYATSSNGNFRFYEYQLKPVIKDANIASVSKSTPGSWPEEGEIRLVPGVDFAVHEYCKKHIFSWYRDYVDPDFEFELSDYDSESEYSRSSSEDDIEHASSDEDEETQDVDS